MQHKDTCLCACGFDSVDQLLWRVDFLAFFRCEKAHSETGATMCGANSPSVSCVSVQSSNTSGRVRRPQSDAISEYVYCSVNQNPNRTCPPCSFPNFFFQIYFFPSCHHHIFFPWNNLVRRTFYLLSGFHRVSRQGSDSDWECAH